MRMRNFQMINEYIFVVMDFKGHIECFETLERSYGARNEIWSEGFSLFVLRAGKGLIQTRTMQTFSLQYVSGPLERSSLNLRIIEPIDFIFPFIYLLMK